MTGRSLVAPILDAAVAVLAVYAAYWFRFDPEVRDAFMPAAARSAVFAAMALPAASALCGLYRRGLAPLWPLRLMAAGAMAFAATFAGVWATTGLEAVSRFAFAAAALLAVLVAGAWRAAARLSALWRERAAPPTSAPPQFEVRAPGASSIAGGLLRVLRSRELIRNLVFKDLKLKYRGSTLGFVWSLANPLLMLLVYSLAFTYILGIRKPAFVYFLLIGLLPWTFFAQSMGMATTSVTDGAGLLRSVRFPRAALPLSTVLFNLLQYLMTFGVLLPVMMLAFAVSPAAPMLAYPLVLLLLVLFVTGAALMVATSATFFRDVKHLVEVALGVMFWTTPIIYDLQDVPEALRLPILLSPMSPFVTALHDIFYAGAWPSAPTWVAALAWTTAAFFGGVTVFLSFEDRLVEHV